MSVVSTSPWTSLFCFSCTNSTTLAALVLVLALMPLLLPLLLLLPVDDEGEKTPAAILVSFASRLEARRDQERGAGVYLPDTIESLAFVFGGPQDGEKLGNGLCERVRRLERLRVTSLQANFGLSVCALLQQLCCDRLMWQTTTTTCNARRGSLLMLEWELKTCYCR